MLTVKERYESDPLFHNLVDLMLSEIMRGRYTPTEIREAAMLAQIKYEDIRPRATRFTMQDYLDGKV